MSTRIRSAVAVFLGLSLAAIANEARGRILLRHDLRIAVAAEAAPVHPHLGNLHPGRRRRSGCEQLLPRLTHHQLVARVARCPDLDPAPRARGEPGPVPDARRRLPGSRARHDVGALPGPQQAYERSLRVKEILDSGQAEYRAISTPRNLLISDCIHAVAAVDPVFGRGHYPLIRVGKPASRYIARQIMTRSVFDQWQSDNSWLISRLGSRPLSDRGRPAARRSRSGIAFSANARSDAGSPADRQGQEGPAVVSWLPKSSRLSSSIRANVVLVAWSRSSM